VLPLGVLEAAQEYLRQLRRRQVLIDMMDLVDEGQPLLWNVRLAKLQDVVHRERWELFTAAAQRPARLDVPFSRFLDFGREISAAGANSHMTRPSAGGPPALGSRQTPQTTSKQPGIPHPIISSNLTATPIRRI
jgi:hypothetical protein